MAPPPALTVSRLHTAFPPIVPRIGLHARVYFRGLRCPAHQAEAVEQTLALCWQYFVRLVRRGQDPPASPTVLATDAARHVKCGRRLCGQGKGKDPLSPLAQRRHGLAVEQLPAATATPHEERRGVGGGPRRQDVLEQRPRDNRQTPVPDRVAFRLDFPAWRKTHTQPTRRTTGAMMAGERTLDLAAKFGISPARVSQRRRELPNDWPRLCCDWPGAGRPCAVAGS